MSKNRLQILFDQATAFSEDGEPDKAYGKIAEIFSIGIESLKETNEDLYWAIQKTHLSLLNNLKRFSETKICFQKLENEIDESESIDLEEGARIIMEMARANWELGDYKEAEQFLKDAIAWDNKNQDAQILFTTMNKDEDYSKAKCHKMVIEGKWDEPFEEGEEPDGFFVTYTATADNEEEALEFIKYFEPSEVHDSLKISEVEILKSEKQPKGVYGVSEYFFFKEDE
jgi:tetratricopeptide (TPR) repeat protein